MTVPPDPMPWQPPPPPAGAGGRGPAVAIVSVVAAVLVLCGAGVFAVWALARTSSAPAARPVVAPGTSPAHVSGLGGTTSTAPSTGADPGKPALRSVAARTVAGPSWAAGDDTYTMAFTGWPFAFRTPRTWGCLAGKDDTDPQAKGWVCLDEKNTGARQRLIVVYRPCPGACGTDQRKTMIDGWFDTDVTLATGKPDARTGFHEGTTPGGLYQLVAATVTTGDPKLIVAVKATSPKATRGTVQKVVNDVITQAP